MEVNLSSFFSWSPVFGAVSYVLRMVNHDDSLDSTNVIGQFSTSDVSAPAANVIGAGVDGQNYKFGVRAVNVQGAAGPWSDPITATIRLGPGKVEGFGID